MDFFNRLLTSDAPAGTHLRSAEWSLRGPLPLWATLLLFAAFAVGSVWLNARETAHIGWGRRMLLAVLRTAALGLLLGLALRPVMVAEFAGERPRGVAVLFDNSQSMTQRDRRVTPRDRLRAAIAKGEAKPDASPDAGEFTSAAGDTMEQPRRIDVVNSAISNLKFLEQLPTVGPVRNYTFGQRLATIAGNVAPALTANESRTALADAIGDLLLKRDGDLPAAVVVVTDGLDNGSKLPLDEAARECKRLGVPLHVYGVGASESGVLQLKDAGLPDTIFYDDTVSVPLRWRGQGFKNGTAVLTLRLGDKVVAVREVPVKDGQLTKDTLTFTPAKRAGTKEERTELVASVRAKDDPTNYDEVKRVVQVVDRKVKVLVIEGAPRWEFKFLMPALVRDRRVEATFLLTDGDPRLLQRSPFVAEFPQREKLFGYDLVILGDVPAAFFGPEKLGLLQEFVREGGGLIAIAGRTYMPSGYDGGPLAEVLPVEFLPSKSPVDPTARPSPYQPELSPAGERSEMLALADTPEESLRAWKNLPGFYWNYPVSKLRAGATALVVHPNLKAGDQPMPLLATQYYGKGPVLFLATDETWRWRSDGREKLFARFWGQAIYQTGLPHLLGNAQRVQVALERGEAVLGRPGYLYARLLDNEFRPLTEPRVAATLEALDADGEAKSRPVSLDAVSGRPGEYRTYLPHDVPGRYELRLTRPEAATFAFRVNLPPRHELEPAGMNEAGLRELAAATGGRFYREEDLPSLAASVTPQMASFTQRREILFWNPLVLLVFVGLVTTEWVVRKFANMV